MLTPQSEFAKDAECLNDGTASETLNLDTDRFLNVPRPFSGNWRYEETAEAITIFRMGKFSFARFLPALFFTVFWNGFTLTHFFLSLKAFSASETAPGFVQWALVAFYAPFALTGAGLIGGLLVLLLASWIRESWIVARNELRHEKRFLRFRIWSSKRDISAARILEMGPNSLSFLDGEEELAVIPDLTLEEARWIASRFQITRRTGVGFIP